MKNSCIVLIPIYKEELDADEFFSVNSSLKHLIDFDVFFIGPNNIQISYYLNNFPEIPIKYFENYYFSSINGYNKLLTSENFYLTFEQYDYMLILQTDAIVLKNELHKWVESGYDYIGAPWPQGYALTIQTSKLAIEGGLLCTTFVGNGGLSLRRISSCLQLIKEFPDVALTWQNKGHAEDLYFSFLSSISSFFKTPNITVAAKFSHDIEPRLLSKLINNELPFGVHAWSKYDRDFWTNNIYWPKN